MSTNRELYVKKLNELKVAIEKADTSDYLINATYSIYKMLIDNNQFSDEKIDSPVVAKKLIKCHRYVDNYILTVYNVDRILIGGLFVMADVYLIPNSILKEVYKKDRYFSHPENFGLLSNDKVNYGTIKKVNENMSVAIMRNSWTDGIINYSSQYEYVSLS